MMDWRFSSSFVVGINGYLGKTRNGRRDLVRGRREKRKPCEKIDGAVSIKCHFVYENNG
jgi:hypothetical protein